MNDEKRVFKSANAGGITLVLAGSNPALHGTYDVLRKDISPILSRF